MTQIGNKNLAFYIKRVFGAILLLSLAGVFFFSGISKMLTMDAFEWTFIDLGVNSIDTAAILARIFIGFELAIGGFLLFHLYLKSVTYPATIVMLVILTGYLILLIIKQGNTGNCGCFGNFIYMKPLPAIWKNLGMIAAVILLYYLYPVKPYKNQEWISALVGMGALVSSFIAAPLNFDHQPKNVDRYIDLSPLYNTEQNQPHIDLRTGRHIVAFMSLTCPHCKKAAYLLHTIKRSNPKFSVYLILSGHPDQRADFFKESHADDVPHILFQNKEAFRTMAGDYVPAIFWINNSNIEKESNYYELDPAYMAQWLKQ